MKNKLLIIFLTLSLIISPLIRADLNIQNLAGTTLASAGALTTVMALASGVAIAATGGLALGALGVAILIANNTSPNSTVSNTPISIQLNPKIPLVTPSGWTPAVSPSKNPTPPTIQTPTIVFSMAQFTGTTGLQACQNSISAWCGPNCTSITYTPSSPTQGICNATNDGSNQSGTAYANSTCPTGYNITGTPPNLTCTLSDTTSVEKPIQNKMQIIRTGNTFSIDPQINPIDKLPPNVVNLTTNKVNVTDSNGAVTTVEIFADGTSKVTVTNPTPTGTTISTTTLSSPDPSTGNVTVTGRNEQIGTGSGAATSTSPPSSGSSTSPTIDISSLNKETTQTAIKSELNKLNDYMKCDDCIQPSNPSVENKQKIKDETKKTEDELANATTDFNSFRDLGWTSWIPTFPTGSCSPMVGSIRSQNVSWNFCPYVAQMNELLGWLLNLFGAWTITGMFFRRE